MTQGDPKLILTADGSRLQFTGGRPLMDQGLENLAFISLFTRPGWVGNQLIKSPIGSDFEEAADQPITRQSLNRVRDAAVRALDSPLFGGVIVEVLNPAGHRLNVNVLIRRTGAALQLSREGGAWFYQTTDPAYLKIKELEAIAPVPTETALNPNGSPMLNPNGSPALNPGF